MKFIPLTKNKQAMVDDSDYRLVSKHKWNATFDGFNWYAVRTCVKGSNRSAVMMHRALMAPAIGFRVDHIDHNGLNNQRQNLRIGTHQQNIFNRRIPINNRSGFKGVCWSSRLGKWIAQICHGKVIHLGVFVDKIEAAKAYDRAAEAKFGDFALTNEKLGLFT